MPTLLEQIFGEDARPKPLALIVDLDATVCTGFGCPLRAALDVLTKLDRQKIAVHYVTARTEVSRAGTDAFIAEHRLPGYRNVHYCPKWQTSTRHKTEMHAKLAREYRVLASIGDCDDEEGVAARAAEIAFVLVDRDNPVIAWHALAEKLVPAEVFVA